MPKFTDCPDGGYLVEYTMDEMREDRDHYKSLCAQRYYEIRDLKTQLAFLTKRYLELGLQYEVLQEQHAKLQDCFDYREDAGV